MTTPPDRAVLMELGARVEAATGPDREIDALIWLAVTPGATRSEYRYTHKASGKECVIDETRDATRRLIIVPAYTGSLDAAMTLMPEGLIARRYVAGKLVPHMWEVSRGPDYGGWIGNSDHSSPCALTAACLKALALQLRTT